MSWSILLVLLLTVEPIAAAQSAGDFGALIQSSLRTKDYEGALQLVQKALRTSPSDPRLWTMEGIAFSGLQKSTDALASYHKALKISPGYLPALEGAAEIEYSRKSPAAIPLLNRILGLRPEDPTSHAMLAVLAYGKHDCVQAVLHFQESRALISTQPQALTEYGVCLVKIKRPTEAATVFAVLLELSPADRAARYDLALAYYLEQQPRDALATLDPLLAEAHPEPDVLDLAYSACETLGLTARAAELLHQAIVEDPSNPAYYLDFASLSFAHNSFQVGIDLLNVGIAHLPNDASLYVARGILRVQLARYDLAAEDFETADRLDPKQAISSGAIGLTEIQRSNLGQAVATLRLRLRGHPGDAFLHYLLAETLVRNGAQGGTPEFQEAVDEASKAVHLEPKLTLAHDLLGGLYLKSSRFDRATQECRLALNQDPSDQDALYHLIQALRKSGRADRTPALLQRFAALREAARDAESSHNHYKLVEAPSGESSPLSPNK